MAGRLGNNVGASYVTGRGRSGTIWDDCPWSYMKQDNNVGVLVEDDFLGFGLATAVATSTGGYVGNGGVYKSWESTGSTIAQLNTEVNGVVSLGVSNTDNRTTALELGQGIAGNFMITAATGPRLWFETRIRPNQIVTQNLFVGLMEKAGTTAATTIFSDGDAIANLSLIGFDVLAAASSTLKAALGINGTAVNQVATAATLVANAWIKLGFKYERNNPDGKVLKWFVNGVEVASITDDTIATFPTAKVLTPTIAAKSSAAATVILDVDWYSCAQLA